MSNDFNSSIKSECQKGITMLTDSLANGQASNWEDYKYKAGQILALKRIVLFIDKKINEE